ncbi:Extracellular matrix organizing protein [Trichinella pseudospiralis]
MGRIGDARDRVSQFEIVTWSPGAPAGSSAFECLDRPGRRLLEKLAIGRADSGLDPLPVTNGGVVVDKHIVESVKKWLCGQVVRRRSRKPKITGSIPVGANTFSID